MNTVTRCCFICDYYIRNRCYRWLEKGQKIYQCKEDSCGGWQGNSLYSQLMQLKMACNEVVNGIRKVWRGKHGR